MLITIMLVGVVALLGLFIHKNAQHGFKKGINEIFKTKLFLVITTIILNSVISYFMITKEAPIMNESNDVILEIQNQRIADLKTVDRVSLDESTWEQGFIAWTRLHFLTDAVFNTDTGIGKAKNPATGQFQIYEIIPKDKTFRERED